MHIEEFLVALNTDTGLRMGPYHMHDFSLGETDCGLVSLLFASGPVYVATYNRETDILVCWGRIFKLSREATVARDWTLEHLARSIQATPRDALVAALTREARTCTQDRILDALAVLRGQHAMLA